MAATVIESLLVTLGLDARNFQQGNKQVQVGLGQTEDAAQRTGKNMERDGKRAATFFTQIRNEILGVMAALLSTRAILNFAAQTTTADAALGRLAANVGMSAHELSIWQTAMGSVGGTAADAEGDMRKLNATFNQWKFNAEIPANLQNFFSQLNVDGALFMDKTVAMRTKLLEISAALSKLDPSERLHFGSQLGISEAMTNFLSQGPDAVKAMLDKSEKLNSVTEEQVENAKKLQVLWWEISNSIQAAGRRVLNEFTPYLIEAYGWLAISATKINEFFTTSLPQMHEWRGLWQDIEKIAQEINGEIVRIMENFKPPQWMRNAWAWIVENSTQAEGSDSREAIRPYGNASTGSTGRAGRRAWGVVGSAQSASGASNSAPASSAAPQASGGKLSADTLLLIKSLMRIAQFNRAEVLSTLEANSQTLVPDSERAAFMEIMRRELALQNVGQITGGAALRAQATGRPSGAGATNSYTHNGDIVVNTQATDARGVSGTLGKMMRQDLLNGQVAGGLTQ